MFKEFLRNILIVINIGPAIKILYFKILPYNFNYRNLLKKLYNPSSGRNGLR